MRIAIVKLSALGDIVHAMIVLQFIKQYSQNISIDWFVEDDYKELLEFHPDINNLHLINIKKAKKKKSLFILFRELNKLHKLEPYDLVIDMQGLIKSAIISKLIPSKVTLGFDKLSARERFSSIFYNKTFAFDYRNNIILRNIELINFALKLNIGKQQIDNKVPFLYSTHKYNSTSLSNLRKNILIIPGASFKAKIYSSSKFAEIVNRVDANFLIVWGSFLEQKITTKIKTKAPNINVVEKLSLDSLISLISQVDIVIGGDTGPSHMAWGLNIPSILLFGPTPGSRNSYKTLSNLIIESNSKIDLLKINKTDYSIKEIEVDDIVKMIHVLLKEI